MFPNAMGHKLRTIELDLSTCRVCGHQLLDRYHPRGRRRDGPQCHRKRTRLGRATSRVRVGQLPH